MTTLEQARRDLTRKVVASIREGWLEGGVDNTINNANRKLIKVMAETHGGEVWLGKINLYDADRKNNLPIMWKWDGDLVHNFDCAFAVPAYDEELVRLVKERDEAEYTGTREDAVRVEKIMARITDIGGVSLVWT